MIKDFIRTLKEKRENSAAIFNKIWEEIVGLAETLSVSLEKPRITAHQTKRANYDVETVEDYYRISNLIPLFGDIISDLNVRFSDETINTFSLTIILPQNLLTADDEAINNSLIILWQIYERILCSNSAINSETIFKSEVLFWKAKLSRCGQKELNSVMNV